MPNSTSARYALGAHLTGEQPIAWTTDDVTGIVTAIVGTDDDAFTLTIETDDATADDEDEDAIRTVFFTGHVWTRDRVDDGVPRTLTSAKSDAIHEAVGRLLDGAA